MIKKNNTSFKIVIITSYPFPDMAATANRLATLAKEISLKTNFEVVVVGPGPRVVVKDKIIHTKKNYSVMSILSPNIRRDNLLLRAFGEFKQTLRLLKAGQNEHADLYIVSIPSIFLMLATLFIRKKPIVFDFRDLVWEYLVKLGGIKSVVGYSIKLLAPPLLKKAKAITVTNFTEKQQLSKITSVPITIVGNGISNDRFTKLKLLNPPLHRVPFRVLYVGNIGVAQNLETLIKAVGGEDQFEIYLVGDGNRVKFLKKLVSRSNMSNVKFFGALEWSDTLAQIEQASCLYGQIGSSFYSAVPSKLYEYLSSGRSVVFGLADGAAKNLVSDFENISVCTPDSPNELREKLFELKRDTADKTVGTLKNQNIIQQHHLREKEAQNLVALIKRLANLHTMST